MARIINDAYAGIVVPPEQVEPFAQAILNLTDEPELARRLGANGRRLCEQEFGWEKIVQSWLSQMSRPSHKGNTCEGTTNVELVQ